MAFFKHRKARIRSKWLAKKNFIEKRKKMNTIKHLYFVHRYNVLFWNMKIFK